MKRLNLKEVLLLVIPLTVILMEVFLIEKPALNHGTFDYFGFPSIIRTGSIGTSFGYLFFYKGLIINFFSFFILAYLILSLLWNKLKINWLRFLFYISVWIVFVGILYFYFFWFDLFEFQWKVTTPFEYNDSFRWF